MRGDPSVKSPLSGAQLNELLVLLQSGTSDILTTAIEDARKSYVNSVHCWNFTPHIRNGKQVGWKTHVGKGRNKPYIYAKTQDELYAKLYAHYREETSSRPVEQVFDEYMRYKSEVLMRSAQTIYEDRRVFRKFSVFLKETDIAVITDDDIRRWLVETVLPEAPKVTELKKLYNVLRQTFDFGLSNKYCFDNPLKYIRLQDYYKHCNLETKTDEERAFSIEELARLEDKLLSARQNPRALMALFAKETGLRAGELPVIRKTDIQNGFVHVHRQQLKTKDSDGHLTFVEASYTKNERGKSRGGRWIPISEKLQMIIDYAIEINPDSEYLFADHERVISKDSYSQYLRKACRSLGIATTNNHAFRMAFNSRLIAFGFNAADRALLLGHEVQTNESYYSLTDNRRLNDIREKMLAA